MAIVKRSRVGTNPLKRSFIERVRTGNVVPVISDAMAVELALGSHQRLIEGYADYIDYPLDDGRDLLKMAKYKAINEDLEDYDLKYDFLNYFKNHVYYLKEDAGADEDVLAEAEDAAESLPATEFAAHFDLPSFERDEEDPLLILADLPLPIYLTTSPYGFVEAALKRAGKEPSSDYCRWHSGLGRIRLPEWPSPTRPLVFHLFGMDTQPNSLILTEDDYLQFLTTLSQGEGTDHDPIPDPVREAISQSALVLLGYELASWPFRVLFWGLIKPATLQQKAQRGIACLQVTPSEHERRFLQNYLKREVDFEVFWGDLYEYTRELNRLWRQ